ncbi:ABC transporter permease [Desulfobaculum sp.]
MDVAMAWRNVWRNPRRSALTILAVAFAAGLLVFSVSWQLGTYETMIDSAVHIHTGHIQILGEGYAKERRIRTVVADPAAVTDVVRGEAGVEAVARRANGFALVSSDERTSGALIVGIEPEAEARISTLAQTVRSGAYLDSGDANMALVGGILATNLGIGPGDELVLLGQGRDGSIAATALTVKGVFSTGQDAFDRNTVHMRLADFQEVFAMRGAVHEVVLWAQSLAAVPPLRARIVADLEEQGVTGLSVMTWDELMPGLLQSIQMDLTSSSIFYLILIVVVAFSILNTFVMAVFERTREFGVLMAVGASPWRIVRVLLYESAALCVVGIILGAIGGSAVTLYFQTHGISLGEAGAMLRQYGIPERMYPQLSLVSVIIGPSMVFGITMLSALFPALRARRLRPVDAMQGG